MAIPDYQTLMLPVLKLAADGEVHKFTDAVETLAESLSLSESEQKEMLPSGASTVFRNRVGWAKSYMKNGGLLEFPKRGYFQITQRGLDVLKDNPSRVDNQLLGQFEEFEKFMARHKRRVTSSAAPDKLQSSDEESPEDQMATAFERYQSEIENELLVLVKQVPPTFFEQLVVDLLVSMGYGGNRQDAARAVGKSADGGIDGVIKEDRLGLDVIYIQAKRWEEKTVGRPEIQKFAGALQGMRAKKGVFITTSNFSKEAYRFAESIDSKIILIDGDQLAHLMIEFEIGTSTVGFYRIKQIDSDYFDQ